MTSEHDPLAPDPHEDPRDDELPAEAYDYGSYPPKGYDPGEWREENGQRVWPDRCFHLQDVLEAAQAKYLLSIPSQGFKRELAMTWMIARDLYYDAMSDEARQAACDDVCAQLHVYLESFNAKKPHDLTQETLKVILSRLVSAKRAKQPHE